MNARRRIAPFFLILALSLVGTFMAPAQSAQALNGGPVVLMGIDAEDGGVGGHGPITVYDGIVNTIYGQASGGSGILVIGGGKLATDNVTVFWNRISTDTGKTVTFVNGAAIGTQSFTPFRMLAVVSDQFNTFSGGLTAAENTLLTGRQSDIADFVNNGGGLLGFTNDFTPAYGYMSGVGTFVVLTGQSYDNITPTPAGTAIGITNALDVFAWHDVYTSFPSFLSVLATVNDPNQPTINGKAAAIGGARVIIPPGITLDPAEDTNTVGTQHTVTATVTVEGQPASGVLVDFDVTAGPNIGEQSPPGCNPATCQTAANGQVSWTYQSAGMTGTDTIRACFTDSRGAQRCAEALKKWVAGAPASLTLTPPSDTNIVDSQHCVTATVKDSFGNPTPSITVIFSVSGVNPQPNSSAPTDSTGQASSCYTGTVAGTDTISAFADTNNNGVQDGQEPSGTATKMWIAGPPATLTLTPPSDTNIVDSQHCVTATVIDANGNPTPGITVRFSVSGSVTTSGTGTSPTNPNGQATFCYTGPALPGSDVITAYADTNNNGVQNPGEPGGRATKDWVLALSTPGCKVTDGGRITAANGDKATFGSIASVSASGTPSGAQEYQDHGAAADLNVHSTAVLTVVCRGNTASVFGTATINGSGSFNYRIDLTDNDEPGVGADKYRIRLSTGYDSGEQTLIGGNIQLH